MKSSAKTLLKKLTVTFMPKWYNKKICSTEGFWNEYFDAAEQSIDRQWDDIIWPLIEGLDFDTVLELAPGAGRNTDKLAQVARVIHTVEFNEYALERLRHRFQDFSGPCKIYFHKNDGSDLKMIGDNSITTIYCWDAAVHFDKTVIHDYVKEFSRVLKPNGTGFFHYSNLGGAAKTDIRENPHFRSNMSEALFKKYCAETNLHIIKQVDVPWGEITDCVSLFRKENAA